VVVVIFYVGSGFINPKREEKAGDPISKSSSSDKTCSFFDCLFIKGEPYI